MAKKNETNKEEIACPRCGKSDISLYGRMSHVCQNTKQRYKCKSCTHVFSLERDNEFAAKKAKRRGRQAYLWKKRIWRSPPELNDLIEKDPEPLQQKIERLLYQEYGVKQPE